MRDLVFVLALPALMLAGWKKPFISLGLCIWTALIFPNGWMYGFATVIRVNLLFALLMFASYALSKPKKEFRVDAIVVLVFMFMFWSTVTTIFGVGSPDVMWDIWSRVLKAVILFLFILLVIEKKLHFDFFLGCVVLSVGFFAVVEGLKYIATGGGHAIVGLMGHVLGDRNELSIAFVMTIPICLYLRNEYASRSRFVGLGLLGVVLLLVLSVLGTNSRGGLIALLFLAGYLFLKSRRKMLILVLSSVLVFVAMQLLSDQWFDRMNTIQSADKDASFMGRVVAWKMATIMISERPILGGGFKAVEYSPNWFRLAERFDEFAWFYTGDETPDPRYGRAAHSVYFQLLGDHGFIGLGIYLLVLLGCFMKLRRVAKMCRKMKAPEWISDAAVTLQLSLAAFCLGGAALSFAYFDLTFAIFGLVSVLSSTFLREQIIERTRP